MGPVLDWLRISMVASRVLGYRQIRGYTIETQDQPPLFGNRPGLALLPVALLRHLAPIVGLIALAIEPVEGDVVGQITARESVGPDIPANVPDSHDANGL